VAQFQPKRSEEHLPGGGAKPQLSLVKTPSDATQDAVWFTGCAWCSRIRVDGRWLDEQAALELIGHHPLLTHGICPTCFAEVNVRAAEERRLRRTA
jgi:hypothetical protein